MSSSSKKARVNDVQISFYDVGRGYPVIFLHSFNHSKLMWMYQLQAFAVRGFRVVAPDFRGHGETSFTPGRMSIEDFTEDVIGLIQELGLRNGVIVGSSLGGYVAMGIWRKAREMIKALILAGTKAHPDSEEEKERRAKQIEFLKIKGVREFAEVQAPKRLSSHTVDNRPWVVDLVKIMSSSMEVQAVIETLRALMGKNDDREILKTVDVPTLIFCGKEDVFTPCHYSVFIHENVSGSKLVILDNAAHICVLDQPETFNEVSMAFLREKGLYPS
jgi:Predicted hydrolases or acyltransferases (alpha/beta hydrolase superfamily)